MSTQVNRLHALLERVQENRAQPRTAVTTVMAKPAPAARMDAPAASPVRAAPAASAPAPRVDPRAEPRSPDRAKAGATPLEMAFEDQLSGAHAPPQAKPAAPATREPALREAAPVPREGAMLVDPVVAQPSKPIVQVVSKHPPSVASNFGELLKRSLSLRPR